MLVAVLVGVCVGVLDLVGVGVIAPVTVRVTLCVIDFVLVDV